MAGEPRLTLPGGLQGRAWTPDHAAGLVLAYRDPAVRHYAGRLIESRVDALEWIREVSHAWSTGTGAAWVICNRSEQVLGSVRFALMDADLSVGSVGYWLSPEARGQGAAASAVARGSRLVFHRLGWHRIELYHAVENERSCAVARRAGFAMEGVMRSAMRYPIDGRWSDEHLHARLAEDPDPF